ncbi:uncharacterized protein [Leptinotarsa decemlineata]|uniref:uncharacterized protein n=1 Tax=Leptinotarsa decemlineata TaxID=7539 RepID=UPI003D3080A9
MSTNLRQYKENENRIHDQLYDNLCALKYFYQPSQDFKRIFKKDMFVKNNKAAFYEVAYYLLDILNPELTRQKLSTWPPYEIRRENKFRSEILQYINELNSIYENADIPHIMPSHLISPGGSKFTKFMLKLSQLVVYEHLRKTKESALFACPKPNKNAIMTRVTINNMKTATFKIENSTSNYLIKYENQYKKVKEQAQSLVTDLADLNDKIGEARKKLLLTKEEFRNKYPLYPDIKFLKENIKHLENEWDMLKQINHLFLESKELLSYLTSNNSLLEYNKEEIKKPNILLHSITNNDPLNFPLMFQSLNIFIEEKSMVLSNFTPSFIKETTEKSQKLNNKLSLLEQELLDRKLQTQCLTSELQDIVKLIEQLILVPGKMEPTINLSDEMFGIQPLEDYS